MIDLYSGQITDLLPTILSDDIYARCISFSLQKEMQRILSAADKTRTLTVIDELPEKVLDVLAVELRSPYYAENMEIEMKRSIIKRTLFWHTTAGTPAAVEELVEIIFGEGHVVEWFDFNEPPYTPGTFDILTNARMTEDIVDLFLQIIQRVKNTRSHIRRILIERGINMDERVGSGTVSHPEIPALNHYNTMAAMQQQQRIASGVISSPADKIINSLPPKNGSVTRLDRASAAAASSPETMVDNCIASRQANAQNGVYGVAAAHSAPHIIIFNGDQMAARSISQQIYKSAGAITQAGILI